MKTGWVITVLAVLLLSACATWVKLDDGAENIRLVAADEVVNCDRLGSTNVSVRDQVGFYKPRPRQVERELANLARNSALELEGDTIVADSAVDEGRQRFSIYRCLR